MVLRCVTLRYCGIFFLRGARSRNRNVSYRLQSIQRVRKGLFKVVNLWESNSMQLLPAVIAGILHDTFQFEFRNRQELPLSARRFWEGQLHTATPLHFPIAPQAKPFSSNNFFFQFSPQWEFVLSQPVLTLTLYSEKGFVQRRGCVWKDRRGSGQALFSRQ